MELFFVTFGAMLVAVFAMAIGVIFGRLPIAGSCGGLNTVDGACQSCTRPCKSRRKKHQLNVSARPQRTAAEHPVRLHRHAPGHSEQFPATDSNTDMESTDAQGN